MNSNWYFYGFIAGMFSFIGYIEHIILGILATINFGLLGWIIDRQAHEGEDNGNN